MSIEEMVNLLMAELKDDIIGAIKREGNVITVTFINGSDRIIWGE